MILYPPDDPFLINTAVFGIPLVVRWYGALIMSGALLAAWVASRRAIGRSINPDHVWNQLMFGLVLGIVGARVYYVAFEWERFAADPLSVLNLTTGGLAIHGALIGAIISAGIYTRYAKLSFWAWADVCIPGFPAAQAIGRWGNFFNQEAYGAPTDLGFGVRIDPMYRLPPYSDMQAYPGDTLFHPTFLYESIWNLIGFGLLLLVDRMYGWHKPTRRRWLHPGDLLFLYGIFYSAGRFWIEGLRTDSLCLNGVGGDCAGSIRVAQLISLIAILIGIAALIWNHRRQPPTDDSTTSGAQPQDSAVNDANTASAHSPIAR